MIKPSLCNHEDVVGLAIFCDCPDVDEPEESAEQPQIIEEADEYSVAEFQMQAHQVEHDEGDYDDEE